MKYRKRPVVVEAVQFPGYSPDVELPEGVCDCLSVPHGHGLQGLPHIHTLEGVMKVSRGDFVITGVRGERYPCKPDIFAQTYERAE